MFFSWSGLWKCSFRKLRTWSQRVRQVLSQHCDAVIDSNNHKKEENPNDSEISSLATDEASLVGDQVSSFCYHISRLYIWLYV